MSIKYLKGIEVLEALEAGKYVTDKYNSSWSYIFMKDNIIYDEKGHICELYVNDLYEYECWTEAGCKFIEAIDHLYNGGKVKDLKSGSVYHLNGSCKNLVDAYGSSYNLADMFMKWKKEGVLICL